MEQWREDVLAHYGVLGMKWGIRRYQPYSVKPRGSGKSGKEVGEASKGGSNGSKSKSLGSKKVSSNKTRYKQVKEEYDSIENKSEKIRELNESSDNIQNLADELYKDYEKEFNSVELSSKQKEKIWSNLHDMFGNGPYDSELFDDEAKWLVDDEIMNNVNKSLRDKREKFDEAQNKYWKDCDDLVSGVVSKYKDTRIVDANVPVKQAVQLMLSNETDTSFMAYMYRHFDDYWVNDTDAHYDSVKRLSKDFTAKDYNRKYGL